MSSTKRFGWVDGAKGMSIILVVMMHAAYGTGNATGTPGFMHYIIGFATPFRMPEFFLISGLFLSKVIARDWRRYFDRRVVHYFYFYAIWAVILCGFKCGLIAGNPVAILTNLVIAIYQPYSVLWFIYMLAIFSLAAKILFTLRAPHWAVLGVAALLQMAPIHTPSYVVDQFAEYFVYFYAGYVFAPAIFRLVDFAAQRPVLALGIIAAWAIINGTMVFWPGFAALPGHFEMGLAALPGLHLILAITGSLAICVSAAMLSRFAAMNWLKWLGAHSIVVYLAFSIPMAISREVLIRFDLVADTGLISLIVLIIATLSPLVLYWLIKRTGWGKFLFTRPTWAHLPGVPGAKPSTPSNNHMPAE